MKRLWLALLALICGMSWISGCSEPTHVEERLIVFPPNNPRTTRATAIDVEKKLLTKGMSGEIGRHFPDLKPEQLRNLFVGSGEGMVQGRKQVIIRTGIRYQGTLPEVKAVADYEQTLVRREVIMALITPTHVGKVTNGTIALVLEYPTSIPIDNTAEVRAEMDWIWEAFVLDAEHAKLRNAVIRAVRPNGGLLIGSKSLAIAYEKRSDGKWYPSQPAKK